MQLLETGFEEKSAKYSGCTNIVSDKASGSSRSPDFPQRLPLTKSSNETGCGWLAAPLF
jgi:hypothetical protein